MRNLKIDRQIYSLIPIAQWRSQHALPESFGVSLFEPKDYTGLAALDQAGADLNALRARVLAAVPSQVTRLQLLSTAEALQEVFEAELRRINPRIGLREPEVEFAVAGFGDVCRTWAYTLIRARSETPDFATVYGEWVYDSVRISAQEHVYNHEGQSWTIRILNSIYGRIGLAVTVNDSVTYVFDPIYRCPAEGFMASLLQEVADRLRV